MKRKWAVIAATTMALTLGASQVMAAVPQPGEIPGGQTGEQNPGGGPGGNTGSYTHGSDETVTEDMLVTEAAIAADYDINEETQGSAKKGEYTSLFHHDTVEDVYISIDENNWNYMLQNANEKPTVLTNSVTINGETVEYTGIKTKGNLTLSSVWQSDSDRFSFTVNFKKFISKKNGYSDNQNFYGLTKVAFNNIYGDASLMKEYLSYELMSSMGVATPCYSLVHLYINDEFWGVYMMVESVDSALTQRNFQSKDDYLVKPEASGGDLVYDSALDAYINEAGEFDFSSLANADGELEYPSTPSNPLYQYNGLWENDEETFEDVRDSLPVLFRWLKTLNELNNAEDTNTEAYKETLESIVDVDGLLRYFAANTYLVNLDSYQSEKMQNYTLYLEADGKAHVLPWDYNYSFGGYGVGSASDMVNFSISNPVIDVTLDQRPLLNVLLQNEDYRALYETYLEDCCIIASAGGTTSSGAVYEAGNFAAVLSSYAEILNTTYEADPTAFYTVAQYQTATVELTALIADRTTAVMRQLAGDTGLVETSVNLQAIGDAVGGAGGNPGDIGGNPSGDIPGFVIGDVTGDGEVKLEDAQMTLKAALRIITLTEEQEMAADVDRSGSVDLIDAQMILKAALRIITLDSGAPEPPEGEAGTTPPELPEGEAGTTPPELPEA